MAVLEVVQRYIWANLEGAAHAEIAAMLEAGGNPGEAERKMLHSKVDQFLTHINTPNDFHSAASSCTVGNSIEIWDSNDKLCSERHPDHIIPLRRRATMEMVAGLEHYVRPVDILIGELKVRGQRLTKSQEQQLKANRIYLQAGLALGVVHACAEYNAFGWVQSHFQCFFLRSPDAAAFKTWLNDMNVPYCDAI